MKPPDEKEDDSLLDAEKAGRIYFLPNLMTALNLFFGFVAVIRCIQAHTSLEAGLEEESTRRFTEAVWCILAAVIFDGLDGRLARLGGKESLFGKEFDSIADIISFGMAPAMMVFFLILSPTKTYPFFQQIGWLLGFFYLLCAGIRLSRFNVITHPAVKKPPELTGKDFLGLPVPAAAGMIASLVLVMNSFDLQALTLGLPVLMVLIAVLMVSSIRYPSFKHIGWNTHVTPKYFLLFLVVASLIFLLKEIAVSIIFLSYIFFGLFRFFWTEILRKKSGKTTEQVP